MKKEERVILLLNIYVKRGFCNGSVGIFEQVKDNLLICKFNGKEELIEKTTFEVH